MCVTHPLLDGRRLLLWHFSWKWHSFLIMWWAFSCSLQSEATSQKEFSTQPTASLTLVHGVLQNLVPYRNQSFSKLTLSVERSSYNTLLWVNLTLAILSSSSSSRCWRHLVCFVTTSHAMWYGRSPTSLCQRHNSSALEKGARKISEWICFISFSYQNK